MEEIIENIQCRIGLKNAKEGNGASRSRLTTMYLPGGASKLSSGVV